MFSPTKSLFSRAWPFSWRYWLRLGEINLGFSCSIPSGNHPLNNFRVEIVRWGSLWKAVSLSKQQQYPSHKVNQKILWFLPSFDIRRRANSANRITGLVPTIKLVDWPSWRHGFRELFPRECFSHLLFALAQKLLILACLCFFQWPCVTLHLILHYFLLTNYAWMLCEGFYLHTVLVSAFISEQKLVKWLIALGWSAPALVLILYGSLRGFVSDDPDRVM